jgi:hypothetical protein
MDASSLNDFEKPCPKTMEEAKLLELFDDDFIDYNIIPMEEKATLSSLSYDSGVEGSESKVHGSVERSC